jgi:hypothetical protein
MLTAADDWPNSPLSRSVITGARPTPVTPTFGSFEEPLGERFRFEAELGRGGMGTVYRAMDLRLGRPVAIKILHPALTNDVGVARFQSEIRIAAGLSHPRIVSVHDSGEAAGHLYYVMDFVAGETLRAKIKREKQLAVDEAIAITAEVADGLQYAHDHNVVHRDIKPENIILCDGHACVVDFGLARALDSVDENRLTASGLAVGTPHYLSPEQASAEKDVGPKADQYALACVLYEMLAGEPPFTGPTASSIAMRHITATAIPLRARRRAAPTSVEAAVSRAMEKVPADRFPTVRAFVQSCGAHAMPAREIPKGMRRLSGARKPLLLALAIFAIGAITSVSSPRANTVIGDGLRYLTGRKLDTLRYVVFPFTKETELGNALDVEGALRDALARWTGVSVAGGADVEATLQKAGVISTAALGAAARKLRAGRYVTGRVSRDPDGLRVRLERYDAAGQLAAVQSNFLVPLGGKGADSIIAVMASTLLFPQTNGRFALSATSGTRDAAAFALFLRADAARDTWNLPQADSLFTAALRRDPGFAQASLALGEVRLWQRGGTPDVARLATQALDRGIKLSAREQLGASALLALATKRFAAACARYDSVLATDSLSFSGWFGAAECARLDDTVMVDPKAPSGWRFRSSRHHAIAAINRAFDLLPVVDDCCVGRMAEILRPYYKYTASSEIRIGVDRSPKQVLYGAFPEWKDDTLAFTPYPIRFLTRAPPASKALAVRQQRNAFHAAASRRVALAPRNADALQLLGEAMELRGDAAALDTIRVARGLATRQGHALQLAANEVWLRLKYALPNRPNELVAIRQFAESLLSRQSAVSSADAASLSSIAALLGDADRAANWSASLPRPEGQPDLPTEITGNANAFQVYAALGGPSDSLREVEKRVASGIANEVLAPEQPMMRAMWLGRGARLAFPIYRAAVFPQLDTSEFLIGAERAYDRKDMRTAKRILADVQATRASVAPADVTLDALFPETWLLLAMGDTLKALERIAPTLDAVSSIPSRTFRDPVLAGSLVQAMMLRARLHEHLGDHASARTWARAVVALTNLDLPVARSLRATAVTLAR